MTRQTADRCVTSALANPVTRLQRGPNTPEASSLHGYVVFVVPVTFPRKIARKEGAEPDDRFFGGSDLSSRRFATSGRGVFCWREEPCSRKNTFSGSGAALVLVILVVIIESLWVTDNERIEKVVYDVRAAVLKCDADGVLVHLARKRDVPAR